MDAGAKKGLSEFLKLKMIMDNQLITNQYSGWSKFVLKFSGDLCIASTGLVSINRDLEGNELQILHNPEVDQQSLLYGITYDQNEGAMVMIWPNDQDAPKKFVDSILSKGKDHIPGLLLQFMFAYVENSYFSNKWWQSLTMREQKHLSNIATIPNAYYSEFSYFSNQFVPWKVTNVFRS